YTYSCNTIQLLAPYLGRILSSILLSEDRLFSAVPVISVSFSSFFLFLCGLFLPVHICCSSHLKCLLHTSQDITSSVKIASLLSVTSFLSITSDPFCACVLTVVMF